MKKFKQEVYSVFGRIYIPDELLGKKNLILHISDTPSAIYPALRGLLRKLKPQVILHTGDLCDHIAYAGIEEFNWCALDDVGVDQDAVSHLCGKRFAVAVADQGCG